MPNQQLVADLADQLWEAGRARAPIEPLTDRHPGLEVDDGYAIQTRNIERRVAAGAHIRERKLRQTTRDDQESVGEKKKVF
jgi:2-keto-4-pentenoate hydratase